MADVFKPNGNFARTFHTPGGEVGRWLRKEGRRTAFISKTLVGVDTGRLKNSIKAGKVTRAGATDLEISIGSDVSHALVHHEGSRPHIITAAPGSALSFGRTTVKVVRHPGTQPNKYLLRALHMVVGGMKATPEVSGFFRL